MTLPTSDHSLSPFKVDHALEPFITNLVNCLYSEKSVRAKELLGTEEYKHVLGHLENYLLFTEKTDSSLKARIAALSVNKALQGDVLRAWLPWLDFRKNVEDLPWVKRTVSPWFRSPYKMGVGH